MTQELSIGELALVWSSLRNILDFEDVYVPCRVALINAERGQFPVDSHTPIFLEIPSEDMKRDLSGRFGHLRLDTWRMLPQQNWSPSRTILLPVYAYDSGLEPTELRHIFMSIIRQWNTSLIPDNIACAALAVNCIGNYTDERQAQRCFVLLLWANGSANILDLDWFQGPLEDCISAEWYMHWLRIMTWPTAFDTFKQMISSKSRLTSSRLSVFIKPAWLGDLLSVKREYSENHPEWEYEWVYTDHTRCYEDVVRVLNELRYSLTNHEEMLSDMASI